MSSATCNLNAEADDGDVGGSLNNNRAQVYQGLSLGVEYSSWYRFTAAIPKGSTIDAATFYAFGLAQQTYSTTLDIYANKVADAANPTTVSDYNGKALTTAKVTWSSQYAYGWVSPPDLKSVIQEIVNQADWVSGNHLMLLFKFVSGTNNSYGRFYSYASGNRAYLSVTYTAPPSTSIKTVSGVAYASISKVAGLAKASMKKVAGLA